MFYLSSQNPCETRRRIDGRNLQCLWQFFPSWGLQNYWDCYLSRSARFFILTRGSSPWKHKKLRSFIWIKISVFLRWSHIWLNFTGLCENQVRMKTSHSYSSCIWQVVQGRWKEARKSSLSDVSTFVRTPSHDLYLSSFFPISGLRAGSNGMADPSIYGLNIPIHNLRLSEFYLQFSSLPWSSLWTIHQVCSILNPYHKQKSHHGAFPLYSSSLPFWWFTPACFYICLHNVLLHHSPQLLSRIPGFSAEVHILEPCSGPSKTVSG